MNELTIALDLESGTYLYEQIYEYIKSEIIKGKLQRDEKLPSTRSLADFLQVSRSTVDLAYAQLVSEGYIEARPYKGYFVCKVEELFHMSKESDDTVRMEEEQKEEIQYDFSPHGIDMNYFPFATWKRLSKNIFVESEKDLFKLGEKQGDLEFRKTISRYLHSARGVLCEPEQIIIGAGNDYLLLLLTKILGNGRTIAMEEITYKRAYYAFEKAGFCMKSVGFDESGMDIRALEESDADVAYIMPSHQFPTGIVMPIGRRTELLNWALLKKERYLIEDDYDSEFRYKGKPIPALQASDKNGRVIYIGTFSKSIAPAIRISFMVLPKDLLKHYEENCGFLSCTVSRLDQAILNAFIKEGHYERYLNKMRKVYKAKHDILLEELKEFKEEFHIRGENAGLHILLESKRKMEEGKLKELARTNGIVIQSSEDYRVSPCERQDTKAYLLLGYANLSEEEIREGMKRLKEAWS